MIRKFVLLMPKMESTWKHSKILLMDFYSTALYNIFILNKNWVHSFDLSQLPLKIAVLSDTSLFLPFLYMCSTNTPICTNIFCFNGVPIRRIFQKVLSAERKWTCISIHAGYKPLCSLVLASQFFFFSLYNTSIGGQQFLCSNSALLS